MHRTHDSLFLLFIRQLRPRQWSKNLLIFSTLIFSADVMDSHAIARTVAGFFLFSFVAGFVYIINDYMDREADRNHPVKKNRPIASGRLRPSVAFLWGGALFGLSLVASYTISPLFSGILLFYTVFNVFYSRIFKHIVIIDILGIALGFVLRAIAGGLIIDVPFTPWFLLCVMLLSLFLAICKRRQEFIELESEKENHRKVLADYSVGLLDQLIGIVTTAAIISYSLFTFTSGHTIHLMWTIPLVIYGIFRYLYLIHMKKAGGSPEKVLLEDRHILYTVVIYVISIIGILRFLD